LSNPIREHEVIIRRAAAIVQVIQPERLLLRVSLVQAIRFHLALQPVHLRILHQTVRTAHQLQVIVLVAVVIVQVAVRVAAVRVVAHQAVVLVADVDRINLKV
jgi:hypothetical protein